MCYGMAALTCETGGKQMVNDPTLERETVGGNEPIGDPAETEPTKREGGDRGVEREDRDVEPLPDELTTEGSPRERTLP